MSKKILLTGITGLIGGSVLDKLLETVESWEISVLIRPNTKLSRLAKYTDRVNLVDMDLSDTANLKKHLQQNKYDTILHIGALRGGRKFSREQYTKTNIQATEQLVEAALTEKSRFIFCSSVGVFGAIPEEIPANNETPYKEDNYYHYTKIQCEKIINKAILKGLDAVIVRPSITYGDQDNGFPHQLVNLTKHRLFLMSNKNIWMHLCHIETITAAFVNLAGSKSHITGKTYTIADVEPVQQRDLVNFIYRQLYNKNYPHLLTIDNRILVLGERTARLIRNELWTSRFELLAHSWFYQVHDAYADLDLPQHFTIPDFQIVIRNFLSKHK
jgi:nucleoside-diphosphate-sugar epimerase